jgi:hypothetical protein
MDPSLDLEATIADAVNDSQIDESPAEVDTSSTDTSTDTSEVSEVTGEATDAPAEDAADESNAVPSPAAQNPAEEVDEFGKLVGVQQMGIGGRENRIPYSRVKKITEKAVSDAAETALGRKLTVGEKPVDVLKAHVAQIPELTAKVTDYEARLESVGQFENVMANDPQKFLGMLSKIPVYKDFFDFVERAAAGETPAAPVAPGTAPTAEVVLGAEGMPGPDEELTDGSKIYSEAGLQKLLAWHGAQTEQRVSKQFEERYKPIEQDWQNRQRIEATLPVIRKQIEEAKTWPLFTESEAEITKALADDPQISLEGAYRKVVFPKLVAERNATRQSVLQEIKTAPTSTGVPNRAASKPNAPATGPRSLEDIIKEQVDGIRR